MIKVLGGHPQKVVIMDGNTEGVAADSSHPLSVSESWRVYTRSNILANDSDKSFAVPAGQEWQILWIWVEFIATATAGNRQLEIQALDPAGDQISCLARAGAVQAESLTRYYSFAPGNADLTAFRDTDFLTTPIPPTIFLGPLDQLRIFDNNAVDAAADDMVIKIQVSIRYI